MTTPRQPKKITANRIGFKNLTIGKSSDEGDYVLSIKGVTYYSNEDGGRDIEIGESITLHLLDEDPQTKGIMTAIIQLAEQKLKDQSNLE